jgi:hypothetical protein
MFAFKPVSTLTCPVCGRQASETMPTDSCQYFYECTGCKTLLKPKAGDCCVFCSYGDMPCPSIQKRGRAACWRPAAHREVLDSSKPPFPFLRNVALLLHHSRLGFFGTLSRVSNILVSTTIASVRQRSI